MLNVDVEFNVRYPFLFVCKWHQQRDQEIVEDVLSTCHEISILIVEQKK
jgi:hypothetical protein